MVEIIELDSSNAVDGNSASTDVLVLLANNEFLALLNLLRDTMSELDSQLVGDKLVSWLDIKPTKWDWMSPGIPEKDENRLLSCIQLAVFLFSKVSGDLQYLLMKSISYYMNEHVPWSNRKCAVEACKIDSALCIQFMQRFVDELRPELLKSTTSKVSLAGYAKPKKISALRPTLGLGGGAAGDEKNRSEWKNSHAVKSLSSICLLVKIGQSWPNYDQYWPMASTFIMNVLDDSDPLFRAQGCYLLNDFIGSNGARLSKTGLDLAFGESVEVCLTYLPQLTPAPVSLVVIKAAYPVLFVLLQLRGASYRLYLDILEKNILGLISHVQGRDNDADTMIVLTFLVDQLRYIILEHIGSAILVSFPRTNFVINQLLINPYLVERDNGPQLVDSALRVHTAILGLFTQLDDSDALDIVLLYKYDLLGAWTVLCKRVVKYNVGTPYTGELIEKNVTALKAIAVGCGLGQEFHEDLDAIWTRAPETKTYVH